MARRAVAAGGAPNGPPMFQYSGLLWPSQVSGLSAPTGSSRSASSKECVLVMPASLHDLRGSGRLPGDAGHAFDDFLGARPKGVIELSAEETEMPNAPDLQVRWRDALKGARRVGIQV